MQTSGKLVRLIEDNADVLAKKWIALVQSHPGTPTYKTYDEEELYDRAFRVYSKLGKWLSRETTKTDIAKEYNALGAKRQREGFKLSEVVKALTTTRNVLWFKVLEDGFLDTALDLRSAICLENEVIQFFDRAIFFASIGYEQGELAAPESITLAPPRPSPPPQSRLPWQRQKRVGS